MAAAAAFRIEKKRRESVVGEGVVARQGAVRCQPFA